MSNHTSYLQEITYTNSFFSELNPHLLAYTAHIMGFEIPNMQKPFTYCELGCGSGFSLLTYAAANPHGFFIGVDFNTHHIIEAKEAAKKSNLTNILFIEKSIEDIHHDVPECDFIVMHGVYSWVHTDIKKSIRSFIDKKLKPQGLSLISYNTFPGWHVYAPLRMMMREYALGITDNLLEDAREGLTFLEYVKSCNTEYFQAVPSAASLIEELSNQDLRYIVHEYFTEYWQPLWVREMHEEMKEANVSFAGTLPLFLNFGEICLPEEFQQMNEHTVERTSFEAFKDLIRNTMFRHDIFGKTYRIHNEEFHDFTFGIVSQSKVEVDTISLPGCRVISLDDHVHNQIIHTLEQGFHTVHQIYEFLQDHISKDTIQDALLNLVIAEQIKPLSIPFLRIKSYTSLELSQHNKAVLEQSLHKKECVIASPVSGSGIIINQDTAIFLLATGMHGIDYAPEWICEWMELQGYDNSLHLELQVNAQYSTFMETLPFWIKMGVL
jgi:ubiquinone/menaquinone biosynthesis C-methylase UbiE